MREVVVVGAGAHGSAVAWHLARRGHDVLLLDRFEPGHRFGSSHGSSRIFRLSHADPADIASARDALVLWRELEAESGLDILDRVGSMEIGPPAALEPIVGVLEATGVAYERLDAGEAARRWTTFAFRGHDEVLFQPDGGRLHADNAVAAFQACAVAHGAEARFSERVLAILPTGTGVHVETEATDERAACVVVAAGAWVTDLAGGLVDLPPLRVTQEQVFHFAGPEDLPGFLWDDYYGVVSPGEGVKVGEHGTGPVVHPDRRDGLVDGAGKARVLDFVRTRLPGLEPVPHSETTCLYTTAPDDRQVFATADGVVAFSACSGMGFKFAPTIGRHVADLALAAVPARRQA
ncbi:MAG TPA: FAD-dependent oxidoreductase [Acidimicrobiales bacterium]|nr:FAD-dependent oxidoreductase [Acidimicrobiales bacterium]